MIRRSIAFLLLICSLTLLFGCKHEMVEVPADRFRGYWECVKVQMDGNIYETTFPDDNGKEIPVYAFYSMAVADDGTGYFQPYSWLYPPENRQKEGFRWTEENGGINISGGDNTSLFLEYSDGQLILSADDDFKIWFGKVDKFTEYVPDAQTTETEEAE